MSKRAAARAFPLKTVGAARQDLAATGEIPQLSKTVGADGKSRAAHRKNKPKQKTRRPHARARHTGLPAHICPYSAIRWNHAGGPRAPQGLSGVSIGL